MNLDKVKSIQLYDGKKLLGTLTKILSAGVFKSVEDVVNHVSTSFSSEPYNIFTLDKRIGLTKIIINFKKDNIK